MNLVFYKRTIYASKTESNLRNELDLLRFVSLYEKKGHADGFDTSYIQHYVDLVGKEIEDGNGLWENEIEKNLGYNDFRKARLIIDLVYYLVGKKWACDESKHTKRGLEYVEDNMGHGFYLGFSLNQDSARARVKEVDGTQELFLLKCRAMDVDRNNFVRFCYKELNDDISNDTIIQKIDQYNNGTYIELPLGLSTLDYFLLKDEYLDEWCDLLVNLHYFPIQGSLIYSLNTVEQCIKVWSLLTKKGYVRFKVVAYLLKEQMMHLLAKESEYLERNAQSDELVAEDLDYGKSLLKDWEGRFEDTCEKLVELWLETFGVEETIIWFCGYRGRLRGRPAKFVEYERKAIDAIENSLTSRVTITPEIIAKADYQTFLYLMKIASNGEKESSLYEELVIGFCRLTYNGRFIPQVKMEQASLDYMRVIYSCMQRADIDGLQMIVLERYPMEGFKVDYDKAFQSCSADSLWLSTLLLQTEKTGDEKYYWQVVENLFRFANYNSSPVTDYYFMPFYIAEIVAVQVLKEQKDVYEEILINRVSNLYFLLRILTANEGVLSDKNKVALGIRYHKEWEIEKQLVSQQMKEQTDYLDRYVEMLLNNQRSNSI